MNRNAHRLLLIGTVHRDRAGEERLRRLLQELRPARLTLEVSPLAISYRRTRSGGLLARLERILDRLAREEGYLRAELERHPTVVNIRELLELPFEYRAAREFAAAAGVDLDLIDLSEVSARKLRRVETDLITYRNLRTLVRLAVDSEPQPENYTLARTLVLGTPLPEVVRDFLARRRGLEGIGPRDAVMATEIERRLASLATGALVHVGGWVHLLADPEGETLFSRLAHHHPRCLLLD